MSDEGLASVIRANRLGTEAQAMAVREMVRRMIRSLA
jgi:hypothetical protein